MCCWWVVEAAALPACPLARLRGRQTAAVESRWHHRGIWVKLGTRDTIPHEDDISFLPLLWDWSELRSVFFFSLQQVP